MPPSPALPGPPGKPSAGALPRPHRPPLPGVLRQPLSRACPGPPGLPPAESLRQPPPQPPPRPLREASTPSGSEKPPWTLPNRRVVSDERSAARCQRWAEIGGCSCLTRKTVSAPIIPRRCAGSAIKPASRASGNPRALHQPSVSCALRGKPCSPSAPSPLAAHANGTSRQVPH